MNVQCGLILGLMFYKFELGHNAMEADKKHLLCKKVKEQLITLQ